MSPLRGEEFTGRTVEEAVERGLRVLGRKRTEVDIEVLEKGKPANMLGMGGEDARVLLSFQEDEREPEPQPTVDEAEVPRRPDALREHLDEREEEREEAAPVLSEELAAAVPVLKELLELMGIEAEVTMDDRPGREGVDVVGTDLGALIGRGGENLVALQQITSAMTSRRVGRTVHIPLDIEGYRRRREEQLREVARRVAVRVRTTGQAVTLEPMLAYERRIVHLAVQDTPGVRTESVGVDPNRRFGGSAGDVALVVAAPFIGHLLAPVFAYLLSGIPVARVVAGTTTLARVVLIAGVLVAATPLMLAATTVVFFVITVANVAAYTALMQGMYPDRERAQAMANVRIGASIAGIASAAVAGAWIDVIPAAYVFAAATALALPGAVAVFWVRHDDLPAAPQRRSAVSIARAVWGHLRFRRLLHASTVFGTGNLMNAAIYPIMIVDHFDAPNTFIGIMYAVQSATMIAAYFVWGRVIDRGSSLRLSLLNQVLVVLVPLGYLVAPNTWALLPVAVVTGIIVAGGELTFYTNVVQLAPRERVVQYAAGQSLLLGIRGTAAPFIASGLLASVEPKAVLLLGVFFLVAGCAIFAGALREPRRAVAPVVPAAARPAETGSS